jgi:hypothetical protein
VEEGQEVWQGEDHEQRNRGIPPRVPGVSSSHGAPAVSRVARRAGRRAQGNVGEFGRDNREPQEGGKQRPPRVPFKVLPNDKESAG